MTRFVLTLAVAALTAVTVAWWVASPVDVASRLEKPVPLVSIWVVEDELILEAGDFQHTDALDPSPDNGAPDVRITHYFNEKGTAKWLAFAKRHEGSALLYMRDQVILGQGYLGGLDPAYTTDLDFISARLPLAEAKAITATWREGKEPPGSPITILRVSESFDLTPERIKTFRFNDTGQIYNYTVEFEFTPRGHRDFGALGIRNPGRDVFVLFGDRALGGPITLRGGEPPIVHNDGFASALVQGDFDDDFAPEDYESLKRVYNAFLDPTPAHLPFEDWSDSDEPDEPEQPNPRTRRVIVP